MKDIKHLKSILLLHLLIVSDWGPSLYGQHFRGQFADLAKICFVQFSALTPKISVTTTWEINAFSETSLIYLIVPNNHSQHDQGSQKENLLQWNRGVIFTTRR